MLAQKIEDQKKQLRREKDRLIKYVEDYIEQEINKLNKENGSVNLTLTEKQLEKDLD